MSEIHDEHKTTVLDNSPRDPGSDPDRDARAAWISLLAQAPAAALEARWAESGLDPVFSFLRRPEIGLVMTRGRAGGTGAAFNLGEATATRCSVRLDSGEEGHAYALGRDLRKAEISALCDALMQTDQAAAVAQSVLAPLAAEREARQSDAARKAAATKVEFFTMTRGESE